MFISNSMRTGSSCFSDTPLLAAGFFILESVRFASPKTHSPLRLCRNPRKRADVMLSGAKHLAFSRCDEDEILRLRLRMTLRHSILDGGGQGWGCVREFNRHFVFSEYLCEPAYAAIHGQPELPPPR